MNAVIKAENLGKKYIIGHQKKRYDNSFRDAMTHTARGVWQRVRHPLSPNRESIDLEELWALKDINFEVQQGERVGIIGRNGAGKSTILKILSRITEPTTGKVRIKGRVSSLLEVGTGFHPELTGRENIFLNGAILGMTRQEVKRKFDEIIAFAELEKFLDTPVKRYSSGMYVRLAFAVAAHLEPEILLVDEVLAVGDAAFQKKCLGKMGQVAQEGRTVLFVSHNMGMIRSLCDRSILLAKGHSVLDDRPDRVISHYLSSSSKEGTGGEIHWYEESEAPGGDEFKLRSVRLIGPAGKPEETFDLEKPINVEITYEVKRALRGMRLCLGVVTYEGVLAFLSTDHNVRSDAVLSPGWYRVRCIIPAALLNCGKYHITVSAAIPGVKRLLQGREVLSFTTEGSGSHGSYFPENWPGVVAPVLKWGIDERITRDTGS